MDVETLRKIWCEEIKVPTVKDDDDFFEIGGHSLIMAKIQSRIKDQTGIDVAMDALMRHATVAAAAKYISARAGA